jgi:hypothetical protein
MMKQTVTKMQKAKYPAMTPICSLYSKRGSVMFIKCVAYKQVYEEDETPTFEELFAKPSMYSTISYVNLETTPLTLVETYARADSPVDFAATWTGPNESATLKVFSLVTEDDMAVWLVLPGEYARLEHHLAYDWRRECVDELREMNRQNFESK